MLLNVKPEKGTAKTPTPTTTVLLKVERIVIEYVIECQRGKCK
jgi:hypothetical protein